MSAILIVLLSGLTMFGVAITEPSEVEEEDDAAQDGSGEPSAEASDGSNPITEAERILDQEQQAVQTAPSADGDATGVIVAGSAVGNEISTDEGDDIIDAGAGDDTVDAGAGEDRVQGGTGNDILFGAFADGSDDDDADTLSGGEGDDTIHMGDTDEATGGEGADTFVRIADVTSRMLIQDFDLGNDVIVVQHQEDTPPTITDQRVASDGVIVELSDGSQIELAGLRNPIDSGLFSFVDTR